MSITLYDVCHPEQNKTAELPCKVCDFPQILGMYRIRKPLFPEIEETIEMEIREKDLGREKEKWERVYHPKD